MKDETIQFRSKSERDREVDLERNYRQIGIPAIAAASHGCCRQKATEKNTEKTAAADLPDSH